MCGLSAIFNFTDARRSHRANQDALRQMTELVAHRGPDGEGYTFISEDGSARSHKTFGAGGANVHGQGDSPYFAGLGHRRLAIVELSELGHQPMSTSDGRYWIVYNGEIYNHAALARELKQEGVCFIGQSDTEVLLNAFRVWGPACLSRLNGMFSFVIVDHVERRVFAARDRFGIKPLYYWINPNGFLAFASEIKQFTRLPGWRARLNPQRAYDFLAWGATDHKEDTLFDGVMQLAPGQAVDLPFSSFSSGAAFASGLLPTFAWYTLQVAKFNGSFADAAAGFRDLFDASVERRLRSDVPVGACLSGGLDSSSIVSLMDRKLQERGGGQLETFSACSEIESLDERKWIDIVSKHVSSRPHYVRPNVDGLLDALPRLTWHQDEPFATTSIFAQWKVFEKVGTSQVKVMLDGQGADEQLAGYDMFFGIKLAGLLMQFKLGALGREFGAIRRQRAYPSTTLLMFLANSVLPPAAVDPLRKLGHRTSLNPDWIDLKRLGAEAKYPFFTDSTRGTSIEQATYNQVGHSNLQKLLRFEDRNSMAFSIEARVPFLDHHLVEFALGLPDEFKLEAGVTKRVLREAMAGILPEPIRVRSDKLGFQTAQMHWMRGDRQDEFAARVKRTVARAQGIFKPSVLRQCDAVLEGKMPFTNLPWKLISFGEWMDEFDVAV